jgi:hypothetical protein
MTAFDTAFEPDFVCKGSNTTSCATISSIAGYGGRRIEAVVSRANKLASRHPLLSAQGTAGLLLGCQLHV